MNRPTGVDKPLSVCFRVHNNGLLNDKRTTLYRMNSIYYISFLEPGKFVIDNVIYNDNRIKKNQRNLLFTKLRKI